MESASAAPKHVDESLWWESFVDLFNELEKVSPVEDLPDYLAEKLRRNHAWFLNSVSRFKPPDQASRLALDFSELIVGSHRIVVKPDLKEAAFRASGFLGLNEVQSYILLHGSSTVSNFVADVEDKDFLYSVLFHYFHERQGLLQCTRRIFLNALHASDGCLSKKAFVEVVSLLACDGFVQNLLASFHDVLLSVSSDYSEVDLKILWADEVLIEGNLLMDTLLLAYYDGICSCNIEQWKSVCSLFMDVLFGSLNIGKVAVSVESRSSFAHMKAKMLLILIETLDLENLLYLIHDEVPFSKGGSVFSVTDIKELDGQISCFSDLGVVEAGPLFLAWAVFLRLVLSLPETGNCITLMEIDHINYVRQAFEVGSFDYLLQILSDGSFRDSDGPVCGFLSVMRTLMSAFIASYELSFQKEDNTLTKILDILYQIYNGQESLVVQFWDKNSFVDSPIRSILSMLEKEYPINITEFVRFLSALCEGSWPAECVYNYINKMSGITTFYEIPSSYGGMSISDIVETRYPVVIPGVEGLTIPSGSCGRILKFLSPNIAVVHWECEHSGILLLVLLLTQEIRSDNIEGVLCTLKLLYKMISFNKDLAFSLMSLGKLSPIQNSIRLEMVMRVDLVKIICTLIFKSVHNVQNLQILSISFNILAEILKCAPSHVIEAVVESNIFGKCGNEISSDSWILNALARMLIEEPGEHVDSYALAGSVLDFTIQLLETGAEDGLVSPLIVFSLQYVSVNHMQWKCKSENSRWNVTLKVFELMRSCIKASRVSQKLHCIIWGILLNDFSIHNMLCRILCISADVLRSYISHHCESREIDYVQDAICNAFDVLCCIVADISQEISSNASAFIQTMLSPSVRPLPVVHAAVSLISYTENSAIQVAAARALSCLCYIAFRLQSFSVGNISLVSESVKIKELHTAVFCILEKEVKNNEELLIAIFDLLTAIAYYQPALLSSLIVYDKNVDLSSGVASDSPNHLAAVSVVENLNSNNCHLIDVILNYMKDSEILLDSDPLLLLSILNFLKALWEGSVRFTTILEKISSCQKFWELLASLMSPIHVKTDWPSSKHESSGMQFLSLRYRCQGNILDIMAYELFFQQKEIQCDNQTCALKVNGTSGHSNLLYAQEILSTWFDSPFLENLIKSYSDIRYCKEVTFRAKVSICVCIVHLISKLASSDSGSLSISLVKKIIEIYNKLKGHSAFSSLLSQYALRGYSGEKELANLVISDLYYLLQGKLEGRDFTSGLFQELSHFLLSMRTFECNDEKLVSNFFLPHENIQLFDIKKLREEFGAGLWDHTDWKTSKEIAERMFMHMQYANLSASIANSKHFALKALVSVVSVYKGNVNNTKQTLNGSDISKPAIESSIQYLCSCVLEIPDSLVLEPHHVTRRFLSIFATQLELFLILSLILFKLGSHRTNDRPLLSLSVLIMKSCGSVIKVSAESRPLTPVLIVKLLLTLLLISLEFRNHLAHSKDVIDFEAEVSLTSIGLLPLLCKYTENVEYCNLSIASIDIIIKDLSPETWLPILREHLPLQLILQNIQERDALASAPVILNFLLTLGRTKGGAEMLYSGKFLSAIMVLLSQLHDDSPLFGKLDKNNINSLDREKQLHIWVLSLAIVITMIQSLDDDSIYQDIAVSALCYFFSEKPYMLTFYFSAMDCLDEDHRNNKRTQAHKFHISLSALKLTEHTLMLLCLLAKYKAPWIKGMKGMDSKLRETVIHILALISRAGQRTGDSPGRFLSLFCRPTTKEEVELNKRPSYIKSRHGWFIRSATNFLDRAMSYDNSTGKLPLVITTRADNTADLDCRSYFTDTVAIHIYRIAFLILNFLCMQTKEAVRRADEVEFVDLAKFPELPSPEILHCLQDQAVSVVTELCGANKQDPIEPEIQSVCRLLLQILEKSLYLELCVTQTCGIRPVLGRAEDFSKEIKGLINVVDRHPNLGQVIRSSEQIIALLYPGMLQTSNSDGVRL